MTTDEAKGGRRKDDAEEKEAKSQSEAMKEQAAPGDSISPDRL